MFYVAQRLYLFYLLFVVFIVSYSCSSEIRDCDPADNYEYQSMTDSLQSNLKWPDNIDIQVFADADLVPSPACLAVSATGDVFVGVDMIGSLGKDMGKGAIIKLIDCNGDGILDDYTVFAEVDNPRGILALGDDVFVLHTRFSPETEKAENMDLVVYKDVDGDGIADGEPEVLISDLSNPAYLVRRGTDHATNGIQIGIDGWIYIAVGDFGYYNATDRSGKKLTMLGGGILRIRPDGTEMEEFSHGLRNVYKVAIDPYMNIFTRDNTNDGGGWNIRFSHQHQTAEYGYPVLFQNFTEEIIPALVDAGGGSGTGALFLNVPRWPDVYNTTPLMADWGRNYLYRHVVTEDGPTFTQEDIEFMQVPQITDVDIDGAGVMYITAWDGAGYSGSPDRGYVLRAVPENFRYEYPGDLNNKSDKQLVKLLKSPNAKLRQEAQYLLLNRTLKSRTIASIWKMAHNASLALEIRVAALFTFAQIMEEEGVEYLIKATEDPALTEFAIRALTDRKEWIDQVPFEVLEKGLDSDDPRVQAAAIIGMGRLGHPDAVDRLLDIKVPSSFRAPDLGQEGPHATPNSEIVIPHLAVRALVNMNAVDQTIDALDDPAREDMALWVVRYFHDTRVTDKLMELYKNSDNRRVQERYLHTLARIYHQEADYDASWWWGTRPDSHGPYYKTEDWEATPAIRSFFEEENQKADESGKMLFTILNTKYRLGIESFGTIDLKTVPKSEPDVDLDEIKNKKGQVGESSIEDVMLALQEIEGDPEKGAKIYVQQGCQVCHSIDKGEVMKGPFMGQIGSIMNREQIAESILKPDASISQGFALIEIKTKQCNTYIGFVYEESAEKITIRNIAGVSTEMMVADIEERNQLDYSMMPEGLANSLSYEELSSLVAFLENQK